MLFKVLTVEELTEDAFLKSEHLKALQIMNTPTDFEDRKKAFIELAVARAAAREAERRLLAAINNPTPPTYQEGLGRSEPQF
jgi:cob(I)alamin adenosyltransferase